MATALPPAGGGVPDWTSGLFQIVPRRALKTRRWSWLDTWIVPAFCFGLSPHRSLQTGRCCKSYHFFDNTIICTRQESQCLPYTGFKKKTFGLNIYAVSVFTVVHLSCMLCRCRHILFVTYSYTVVQILSWTHAHSWKHTVSCTHTYGHNTPHSARTVKPGQWRKL